jgi:hypothetical protein
MKGWANFKNRVQDENRRIQERREKRIKELLELTKDVDGAVTANRSLRRFGSGGQPRSRIFAEKMKIPRHHS